MKHKITLILRSILIDIHFPPRTHVPNLAYSQAEREETPCNPKTREMYHENSSFPRSLFDSPPCALWILASDRSINVGIPEALPFSEIMKL